MKRLCKHPDCTVEFELVGMGRRRHYCSAACRRDMQRSQMRHSRQTLSYGYHATAYMNAFLLRART